MAHAYIDYDSKVQELLILGSNEEILAVCASFLDPEKLHARERRLLEGVKPVSPELQNQVKAQIRAGVDVLGLSYMRANIARELRVHGETYTPEDIVENMLKCAESIRIPERVIDCGCGSGRFSIASANRFPKAKILAIDSSPFATIMCKCNVAVLGLESRIQVVLGDFTNSSFLNKHADGPTLWLGNPPYVRHHELSESKKKWLANEASKLGVPSSGLAGLHAYFFLAIAKRYRENDYGVLVTSAEWLDVKYGQLVRNLLLEKLGLKSMFLASQTSTLFEGVNTTTVITCFDENNLGKDVMLAGYEGSDSLCNTVVSPHALQQERKWSKLFKPSVRADVPKGYVRLGDFARVHRGIVTGANKFWIVENDEDKSSISVPVVTHAREIMGIGNSLSDIEQLSRLIALPCDLETLNEDERKKATIIIKLGKQIGIDKGYVASSRRCWWSINIGKPAAILMTYMARHAPVFVANPHKVRSLNVVHGIYPIVELSDHAIRGLVEFLNRHVPTASGRIYSGGLIKYEPREVEELYVPSPKMLEEDTWRL